MDTSQIETAFEDNFSHRREIGASLSVWLGGQEVVSLHAGTMSKTENAMPWTNETIVPIWSATKGLAAASCLRALDGEGYTLDMAVAELWPEFAAGEKEAVTFEQVLSHSAGLSGLAEPVDITDYQAVIAALEAQPSAWTPGQGHGYHPRTFGFLADEILRRATGAESLGSYFRNEIAAPLGLDLWIGLPKDEFPRVATLYPGRFKPAEDERAFYQAFNSPGTETRRAFTSPQGLNSIASMNTKEGWTAGLASMGGVGSAQALGRFYSCLATGGEGLFPANILQSMETSLSSGTDRTLLRPTAFSAGFMRDVAKNDQALFGPSLRAFGHPGAGGSHAFADPEHGISFAYIMNQMEVGALPNAKSLGLVEAVYSTIIG